MCWVVCNLYIAYDLLQWFTCFADLFVFHFGFYCVIVILDLLWFLLYVCYVVDLLGLVCFGGWWCVYTEFWVFCDCWFCGLKFCVMFFIVYVVYGWCLCVVFDAVYVLVRLDYFLLINSKIELQTLYILLLLDLALYEFIVVVYLLSVCLPMLVVCFGYSVIWFVWVVIVFVIGWFGFC